MYGGNFAFPNRLGRPGLFKRWIALSTGQITIQRISIRETNCAIQRIEIYPVDSLIHLLNNWGQDLASYSRCKSLTFKGHTLG